MQSLDLFLPRILPLVPSCPDILARQAIVDAASEFCEETLLIQYTCDPLSAVKGEGAYELDVPSQQNVAAITKVWYKASSLAPAAAAEIDNIMAYASGATGTTPDQGTPRVFYELTPGVAGIYPVPDTTEASVISARIATKPTRSATSVEDVLYDDWVEVIAAGALMRICAIPNKAFSNESVAAHHAAKFYQGISRATNIRIRGRLIGSMSVAPRALV